MSGSIIEFINKAGVFFCDHALRMLIQSSILIAALFVVDLVIRKRIKAVLRYCLWLLVFIKLVTPTTLSLPTGIGYWLNDLLPAKSAPHHAVETHGRASLQKNFTEPLMPSHPVETYPDASGSLRPHAPMPVETHSRASLQTVASSINMQGIIFLCWIVGELVLVALLLQKTFFVRRIVAQSRPVETHGLASLLIESCRKIGIKKKIELRVSNSLLSPAACGLLKPRIILPNSLLKCFSAEKLRTTMLHELAHIKRKDIWINSLQTFLQIFYFYNPLLWFANIIVRRTREQAVDETVLVCLGEKADTYSSILVDIAEIAFAKPSLGLNMIGVVESKKALTARIKHIVTRPFPKTVKLGVTGIVTIILAAFVLLPMAKAQKEIETNNKEIDWSEAVDGLRWRISLPSDRIEIGKPIVVDMEFQNVSDKPFRIFKEPTIRDNLYPILYTSDGYRNMYSIEHEDRYDVKVDETVLIEPGDIYRSSWSKMTSEKIGQAKITISYFSPKNTNTNVTNFWSGNLKTQECKFTIVSEDGTVPEQKSAAVPISPPNNSDLPKLWDELGVKDQERAYRAVEKLCTINDAAVKLIEQRISLEDIGHDPFPVTTAEWQIARSIRILELIGSEAAKNLLARISKDTKGNWPSLFAQAAITRLANQPKGSTVEKFGYNRGIPIYDGFLFFDGKYMPAPYIVERWGVDVYINGVLVERGHDDILGIDVIDKQKDRQETRLKSGQVIFDHTKGGEMSTGKQRGIELIVSLLSGSTNTEPGRANRQATFTAGFESHPQLIQRLKQLGVSLPDEITNTGAGKKPNNTPTPSIKPFSEMSEEEQKTETQIRQDLDQISAFRTGFRTDFSEVYKKADELVKKYSGQPEVIGRIYLEVLIDHALSGLAKPQEAVQYAKKAEQFPLAPVDKAQLYLSWGDSIQFTHSGAKGEQMMQIRREASRKYLMSMKVMLDENFPKVPPTKPIPPDDLNIIRNYVSPNLDDLPPEAKRVIQERQAFLEDRKKKRDEYYETLEKWNYQNDIRNCTEYSRDLIVKLYTTFPFDTEELKELAAGVLGKSEMVDDLISRVENRIKERLQSEISPVTGASLLNPGEKEISAEAEIKDINSGARENDNSIEKMLGENVNKNMDEKSRTKVILQADVLSINTQLSTVTDFLNNHGGINNIPGVLTQTQAEQFKKWAESIPGTSLTSNLTASAYPLQRANLDSTKKYQYITDYEKDPNSPGKYNPKEETYQTGIELNLTPGSIRKDEPVSVYINFKKTDIVQVLEKSDPSGNPVQIPELDSSEISTQVSIPSGEYSLISDGAKSSNVVTKYVPAKSGRQTILLIKLEVKVEDKPDALTPQEKQLEGIWRSSRPGYTDSNQEVTTFMILNNDRSWLHAAFFGREEIPTKIALIERGPLWFCSDDRLLQFFPPPAGGGDHLFNQKIFSLTPETLSFETGRPMGYILEYKRVTGVAETKIRETIAKQP